METSILDVEREHPDVRPLLSTAGQKGFRSLPPEVAATIDRLKQTQRI